MLGAVLVGGRICLAASIRGGSERLDGEIRNDGTVFTAAELDAMQPRPAGIPFLSLRPLMA